MQTVMKKEKLITILTDNRKLHAEMSEAAKGLYQGEVEKALLQVQQRWDAEKRLDLKPLHALTLPKSFLKNYDEAIEMLNETEEENISLTPDDFKQFVKDKWPWAHEFLSSNAGLYGAASFSYKVKMDSMRD